MRLSNDSDNPDTQTVAAPSRPLKLSENLRVTIAGQELSYEQAVSVLEQHLNEPANMVRADLLLTFTESGEGAAKLRSGIEVSFSLLEKIETYRARFERLTGTIC